MKHLLISVCLAAAVSVPQAAFSPDVTESATGADDAAAESASSDGESGEPDAKSESSGDADEEEEAPNFGALDIDILVLGGFGGLLYPHIEPGVDVGVVPLGKDMAISVGGGVDLGWCALCAVIDLVSDLDISSSYVSPQGRVALHFGTLGGLLPKDLDNFTLDPYVGFFGGPVFYKFAVKDATGGASLEAEQFTIVVGPVLGIRLGFANNRLLLLGEYRWSTEAGFTSVTVRDENGTTQTITGEDFSRSGNDFILGIGLRI